MAFTTYANAMRSYFETRWAALGDGSMIVFENVEYEPAVGTAYILFAIRPVESEWASPGSSDSIGAVSIAVMSPTDAGPEANETLAAAVASCLARKSDSGVQFMEATIEPIGPDGAGFYQTNVRVPWWYTEAH
jgi:hypothetical protein